jgi:CRP-like cAMP-binding protein
MAIDSVAASLLRIPIFAGLKPLQITEIARQAVHCVFRRGDIVIKAGMPGDAAYLVLSGEAERRPAPGSRAAPQPIEPGSLVGELAMLVEHVYGTTVVAAADVHCLKIGRTELHLQMLADPDLAARFARAVKERLIVRAC